VRWDAAIDIVQGLAAAGVADFPRDLIVRDAVAPADSDVPSTQAMADNFAAQERRENSAVRIFGGLRGDN
jgi:hypothetical protein